jgi:hypothetical protein
MPKAIVHVCLFVAALFIIKVAIAAVFPTGFAPNDACVGNERMIGLALLEYIQDNDEHLPSMAGEPIFETELAPYVPPARHPFLCPATGKGYTPNASDSYKVDSAFPDVSKVETFKDSTPHPDGLRSIAYLDTSVRRGGILQGDPTRFCVENVQELALAVDEYTQDYDERLPPMATQHQFRTSVFPYVRDPSTFICPVTMRPYTPNATVSGQSLASIQNPYSTQLVADSIPHPDGSVTTAFADFHVTNPDVPATEPSDLSNLNAIGTAFFEYVNDNDEKLPPMDTEADFQAALLPYADNNAQLFISPDSGMPYVVNTSLNGMTEEEIASPFTTPVAMDADRNNDGTFNTMYADSHVGIQTYRVPTSINVGLDGMVSLDYLRTVVGQPGSGECPGEEIADLTSDGGASNMLTYDVQPGFPNEGYVPDLTTTLSGDQRLLTFANTQPLFGPATIDVWDTAPKGAVTSMAVSGLYDGWKPVALANHGEANIRMVWQRWDGTVAVWTVSPSGRYKSDVEFTPPTGEFPIAIAAAADGSSRVLLSDPYGDADIWTVPASGTASSVVAQFAAITGQTAVGIAMGRDGLARLLWNDGSGMAEVWKIGSDGSIARTTSVDLGSGWTATQLAISGSGSYIILSKALGATGQIQRVRPDGRVLNSTQYSAQP